MGDVKVSRQSRGPVPINPGAGPTSGSINSGITNQASRQGVNGGTTAGLDDDDLGLTVSEGDTDTGGNRLHLRLADEDAHLLSFLEQSADDKPTTSVNESDDGFDSDDSSIEHEEEQAIQLELKRREAAGSNSHNNGNMRHNPHGIMPSQLVPASNGHALHEQDSDGGADDDIDSSDDDDDNDSSSSSWNDAFLDDFDEPATPGLSAVLLYASDDDDDSADDSHGPSQDNDREASMWEYFFSDGSASSGSDEEGSRRSTPEPDEATSNGNSHSLSLGHHRPALPPPSEPPVEHSGDSTDEDDGVPPERKRRRAPTTRPIEVLGASSLSARPPVLGSWRISRGSRKNIGIIDGLTTRTLSPPPPPPAQGGDCASDASPAFVSGDKRDYESALASDSDHENNNNDDDVFEGVFEFLNTDDLSDDENDDEHNTTHDGANSISASPYIYKSRLSRNVPLSAFRTRQGPQAMYESPITVQKRARRRSFGREAYMSPARNVRRRLKRVKAGPPRARELDPNQIGATKDLIEELVEIGAISPFFVE